MCFRSCYISRQIEELMTWLIGSNSLGGKKFERKLWKGQEEGCRLLGVRRKRLKGAEPREGINSLIKQVTDLNPMLEGSSPTAFPLIIWWGVRGEGSGRRH